jgi:hypothetical protein
MISFVVWISISAQMICDGSPHRRECVALVKQCLIEEMMVLDSEEARDAAFEECAENTQPWLWSE